MKNIPTFEDHINEGKKPVGIQKQLLDALKIHFKIAYETGLESGSEGYDDFEKEFWKSNWEDIASKLKNTLK